jgi:putative SOS response-associated peptidase YedK
MCNLYSMTRNTEAIRRLFRVSHNRSYEQPSLPAIFPGHSAPVVRRAGDGERECVAMSWGFVLPQPGRATRRVTNARDDKIDGRFWSASFRARRCLVPVSSYCEPTETTPADWVWFTMAGDEPRPLFAFAGIWCRHVGPVKRDGPHVELDVFSFVTTTPNELTASINHERMPVLLGTAEEQSAWIDGSDADARKLIRPYDAALMRIVQRGRDKLDLLAH